MSFPLPESVLAQATVLATDIDDTLTCRGRILGDNLARLTRLRQAGMKVFLVTGRTAGHGLGLTTYFDIDGAIAENGGVICQGESKQVVPEFDPGKRDAITQVFDRIGRTFAKARPTEDNFMRLTDRTFYVEDFAPQDLERCRAMAAERDLGIVYSSVHLHVCDRTINKGKTLKYLLQKLGIRDMEKVITIGDSPNDEGFFDQDLFPHSVGVKNVEDYWDRMEKHPRYVLPEREGAGFAMLADALLSAKFDSGV